MVLYAIHSPVYLLKMSMNVALNSKHVAQFLKTYKDLRWRNGEKEKNNSYLEWNDKMRFLSCKSNTNEWTQFLFFKTKIKYNIISMQWLGSAQFGTIQIKLKVIRYKGNHRICMHTHSPHFNLADVSIRTTTNPDECQ